MILDFFLITKNFIKSVFVINRNGKVLELNKESISFSYRSSGIKKNLFIIAVKLKLISGFSSIIMKYGYLCFYKRKKMLVVLLKNKLKIK